MEGIINIKCSFILGFVLIVLIVPAERALAVTPSPICGSNVYDIETLQSASYWTITQPGICYDTWGSIELCTINLAFCQSLPPSKSRNLNGFGASQINEVPAGDTYKLLGEENQFDDDSSGTQLIATYPDGDSFDCGTIKLIMYLRCNLSAYWAQSINGQPSEIPTLVTVRLDRSREGCLYSLYTDYAGACAREVQVPTSLSAGSILIILFVCVLAVYLTGGVVYNKCAGATGRELIPNYEMWSRLPSDILAGVYFFVSCITCQDGKSSDAYESI